ncbi:hypothetical protein WA026_013163 [Henosepilachna vigintioctopunctata]|uniref:Alanyl-transfer RNA synthetases family profile domain-containing protein n=1 Tax=Henosepilachna vigintioctopunctata TaxID=420089 RepID=A0AAW1UJX5_9CUCU
MVFKCQENSFLKEYTSKVLSCECTTINTIIKGKKTTLEGYEVILENTILFPEGGGQPSDTGYLNDSRVYHVSRKEDIAVHYVDKPLIVGENVKQVIDWPRREDHMQQHSGQHLLSAILEREYNMQTVSWWLGEDVSYVELDTTSLNNHLIGEIEEKANALIREGRKVTVTVYDENISANELSDARSTRGLPADHKGDIRVINIDGVDSNMCCGTHVTNLCQLQAIKLLSYERSKRKDKTLLYFLCGQRVLKKLENCLEKEQKLTTLLKNNPSQHAELVDKLQKNCKILSKNLQVVLKDLAVKEAEKLKGINPIPKYYCLHRKEADPDFMRVFIEEFNRNDILLFLSTGDENGNFVLYGPEKDVQKLSPEICNVLNGKGAGKGNKFQAKVTNMRCRPEAEKLIIQYYSES